jgi:hypothetical protein
MNNMIVDWANEYDFEMELSQVVMYGLINNGPVKVQWNPSLNGGLGDMEMVVLSPLNFMVLGAQNKLQQAEVCIVRQPVTIEELVRKHGDIAKSVKPDLSMSEYAGDTVRPGKISKARWGSYSKTLKNLLGERQGVIQSRYPKVMRKEFWLRDETVWEGKESIIVGPCDRDGYPMANWCYRVEPGMKIYPRGRVIVTAGGKVLEDQCNPYWSAKFPFAMYRAYRVPWQLAGLSPLEPLAAMQSIYNRITGGEMDTVYDAIEPKIKGPKGAMSQQDWDTMDPGAPASKIIYSNNASRPPEFEAARQLPNYVAGVKADIAKEMDMTSGSSAISQAVAKKQVPGGDSLEMILNSRSTNIRFMARNLKSFLNDGGSLIASGMLQFYGIRHRVMKYGAKGITPHDFVPIYGKLVPDSMQPEDFVRSSTFTIRPGTMLGIQKAERVQAAFAMRKAGDMSRRGLYRALGADGADIDVPLIEKELHEEMAEKAAIAAAAGALQQHGKGKGAK